MRYWFLAFPVKTLSFKNKISTCKILETHLYSSKNSISRNLQDFLKHHHIWIGSRLLTYRSFDSCVKSCTSQPAKSYLIKVSNKNTRTRCEICSKLTIKIAERHHWRRCAVFMVNFEHISHLALVFLLLTFTSTWTSTCRCLLN